MGRNDIWGIDGRIPMGTNLTDQDMVKYIQEFMLVNGRVGNYALSAWHRTQLATSQDLSLKEVKALENKVCKKRQKRDVKDGEITKEDVAKIEIENREDDIADRKQKAQNAIGVTPNFTAELEIEEK
jgi:hypothetical protein